MFPISNKLQIKLQPWMIEWWWRVAYKIPAPVGRELIEILEVQPSEKFRNAVGEHVIALVQEGKEPPAEIATTIYNLANDLVNGQEMVLRTGDYIALQQYMRRK